MFSQMEAQQFVFSMFSLHDTAQGGICQFKRYESRFFFPPNFKNTFPLASERSEKDVIPISIRSMRNR